MEDEVLAKFLLTKGGPEAYAIYQENKRICDSMGIPCEIELVLDEKVNDITVEEVSITASYDMWKNLLKKRT